jgi:hypothetical protein
MKQHNGMLCDSIKCKWCKFEECLQNLRLQGKKSVAKVIEWYENTELILSKQDSMREFSYCSADVVRGHKSSAIILLNCSGMLLTSIDPDGWAGARTARWYLEHSEWTSFHWATDSLDADKLGVCLGKVIQIAMNVCESVIWLPSHAMTWTQTRTAYQYKGNFLLYNNIISTCL